MKTSVLLSAVFVVAFSLGAGPTQAEVEKLDGSTCPASKVADVTDYETQKFLRDKALVPAFPNEPPETRVTESEKGALLKTSTREFLIYDTASGKLMERAVGTVTCTATCNNDGSGSSCSNDGCDATSSGGCTSHSCFGFGCTGGSCTKTSSVEVLR